MKNDRKYFVDEKEAEWNVDYSKIKKSFKKIEI